ncbi:D-isomer specific 2-hydroxyacid dehydrogenase [Caballeronia catudaia]|uniref:D-isomer specific 2-hydroxyacid dehydrogenase n=1 Tax=Caballeronia catudaia TaxID=1777136 RepID=A0A158BFJ7_9BURK|nr:glyoxylate/hydroxypyruvate reductase A [Caballeronia catudaia]SAK68858.1 D-isomer specific 2-hydroxyacid dehydrogenase [Caballeronia catudaia]
MTILYKANLERGRQWAQLFAQKAPDVPFRLWPEIGDPAAVRYLAAWEPPADVTQAFPNLEVIFSTGAGIDQFDLSGVPPHIAVVRMTEPGIVEGMVEYVTQSVLTIHRDLFDYAALQREGVWREMPVRAASTRRVGVLGLGMLGTAVLKTLNLFGFRCAGWSRFAHEIEGVECFAGADSFDAFLARTDILVCLLPLTDATRGLIDKRVFDKLPKGASFINVGRGPHVVQQDLLDALNSGHLHAAILDVTDPEPLPREHAFWTHPRVRLTPHIASATRPETAVDVVLDNLRRHRAGLPLIGAIDRARGY